MKLITDASLLVAIYDERELGDPEIFDKILTLGFEVLIPPAVGEELSFYQEQGLAINNYLCRNSINKDWFSLQTRYTNLGKGEVEVIALGLYFKGTGEDYLCLLDEKKTRKIARDLGLNIIGPLGMLEKLFQTKLLTVEEYKSHLGKLKASKFRITNKEIDERIDAIISKEK